MRIGMGPTRANAAGIGMGPTRANAAEIGMGPTRANAAGIGMGPTRAAAGLGRRVPLAFGGADRGGPAVGSPAGCPRGLASSRARGPVASGPGTS